MRSIHLVRQSVRSFTVIPLRTLNVPPPETSGPIIRGCAKLPDLTIMWPFNLYPTSICATTLDTIQATTELPWWAALAIGACGAKITMYGFNIYNLRKMQQFFRTTPKQTAGFVLTYLNNLVTRGERHAFSMAKNERRYIVYRYGAHSMRLSMLPTFITFPPIFWLAGFHVSMLAGISYMNQIQYLPLLIGGPNWAPNLTVSDPYYILPVLCLATGLVSVYRHPIRWLLPMPTARLRHLLYISPLVPFVFGGLAALPADIQLYMLFVNVTAINLNSLLSFPSVYQEFGLLSSSETLNRMIPQKHVFMELGRSLDRQLLLSNQKKHQLLEPSSAEAALLKPSAGSDILPEGSAHLSDVALDKSELLEDFAKVTDTANKTKLKKLNSDEIAEHVYRIEKRFTERS